MKSEAYWHRVSELLAEALLLEKIEQRDFVLRIEDSDMQAEVASLLAAEVNRSKPAISAVIQTAARGLLAESEVLAPGSTVSRFEVLALAGSGGMGEVYCAKDPLLQRMVALKILPAELSRNLDAQHRFEREAMLASSLNHPNIVTVHEVVQLDSRLVLVTEFIEGETLRTRLNRGPMQREESYRIAAHVASALAAAHAADIMHRDIKPENIMLRRDGLVKIVDFGLARGLLATSSPNGNVTTPGTLAGTPAYMSPEQLRGAEVDKRSDCWSLGVVLYEMLTGTHPFRAETPSDTMAAVLLRHPKFHGGPVTPLLMGLLQKDVRERTSDPGLIAEELNRLQTQSQRRPAFSRRLTLQAGGTGVLTLAAWVCWQAMAHRNYGFRYSLLVQRAKNGKPYLDPFHSLGEEALESGWKFRVEATSKEAGFLYLVSGEDPVSPLHPTTAAARNFQTGWLVLEGSSTIETLSIIWSKSNIAELDGAAERRKPIANFESRYAADTANFTQDGARAFRVVQSSCPLVVDRLLLKHSL